MTAETGGASMPLPRDYTKPPTVDQMFEIQRVGVVLGKSQNKLRAILRSNNAHFFLTKELERPEMTLENEGLRYSTAHFAGRVARIGPRRWSMRVIEAFWVRDVDLDEDDGYRSSYVFEWTRNNVLQAVRSIHAINLVEDGENYNAEPPAVAASQVEHWTSFWQGVQLFETLGEADCQQLIQDMQIFGKNFDDDALSA